MAAHRSGSSAVVVAGNNARIVDCEMPHEGEAFAVIEHPAPFLAPFDEQQVRAYAREQCTGSAFSRYVGIPQAMSRYRVLPWIPNQESWKSGDRRISCALYGDRRSEGSARNARR